jgi:hypothetical protein
MHDCFFLFTQNYYCNSCKKKFTLTSPKVFAQLPLEIQDQFPAILTKRSAITKEMVRELSMMVDSSVGPGPVARIIRERHAIRHDLKKRTYFRCVSSRIQSDKIQPKLFGINYYPSENRKKIPLFSMFDDPLGYAGFTPSAPFVLQMLLKDVMMKRKFYDMEVQRRPGCVLKIDHSFKVVSHMKQLNGKKLFEALHTVVNEYEEIRSQQLVQSTSHDQLREPLMALYKTLQLHGRELVKLVYTDVCDKDRPFLLEIWPSLLEKSRDFPMLELPEGWDVHYCRDIATAAIHAHGITAYMESLAEDEVVPMGLDCEWKTTDTRGAIALLQLALPNKKIYLFHISRIGWKRLEHHLSPILASSKFLKVGKRVAVDAAYLTEDYGVTVLPVKDVNDICFEKGLVDKKNVSLQHLCRLLLNVDLDKSDKVRTGNWENALGEEQIKYAAHDAYASLAVYQAAAAAESTPFRSPLVYEDLPVDEVASASTQELFEDYEDTRVKLDPYHMFKRPEVPRQHPFQYVFVQAFRDAVMVISEEDKAKVAKVAQEHLNCTFETLLNNRPDWVFRRVRRAIPRPAVLRARIEQLRDEFKKPKYVDPETNKPLLSKDALKQIELILDHVDKGCISDPKGLKLYYELKTDKYGLMTYRCIRGTNSVEGGVHQKLSMKFEPWNAGPQIADAVLAILRHRHNIRASQRNRALFPNVGHYEHYILDDIQELTTFIYGEKLFTWWDRSSVHPESEEVFGVVPCIPKSQQVEVLDSDIIGYSPTMKFLSKAQKSIVPYGPVNSIAERRLYAWSIGNYLGSTLNSVNWDKMAEDWNAGKLTINGGPCVPNVKEEILSKISFHLRSHFGDHLRAITRRQLIKSNYPTLNSLMETLKSVPDDLTFLEPASPEALRHPESVREALRQEEILDSVIRQAEEFALNLAQQPVPSQRQPVTAPVLVPNTAATSVTVDIPTLLGAMTQFAAIQQQQHQHQVVRNPNTYRLIAPMPVAETNASSSTAIVAVQRPKRRPPTCAADGCKDRINCGGRYNRDNCPVWKAKKEAAEKAAQNATENSTESTNSESN